MNLKELNSKTIFSSKVQNYAEYRPSYPNSIIDFLHEVVGLNKKSSIADIGSGTGISTKMFLDNGNTVYGVEPNKDMRQAAENLLESYSNFYSIDGSSESTKLQSQSIDIITIAQAFHWFDPEPTKREFLRILKPNGSVVLMWNIRKSESDEGFMGEYLNIIRRYREKVKIKSDESVLPKFFDHKKVHEKVFSNPQIFSLKRLKGELASYSYIPNKNHPKFVSMMSEIEDLFNKYNDNEKVVLEYETHLYYCKMK